jgi:hypothetical protein
MKGKLVKRSNGRFDLYKIEDVDQLNTIASSFDNPKGKLSLKNCQAIELGYDLDEEVSNIVKTIVPDDRGTDIWYGTSMAVGKLCFQKALEILGDKKFSEEDVIKAIEIARKGSMQEQHNGYGRPTESRFVLDNLPSDEIIQSLQQTEWDVEIEMEDIFVHSPSLSPNQKSQWEKKPKLDEDGCLILKRL